MAGHQDGIAKVVRLLDWRICLGCILNQQIKAVQVLPNGRGQDFANGSGRFPSVADARQNRVRIFSIKQQELQHVLTSRSRVAILKILVIARRVNQRRPLLSQRHTATKRQIVIDVHKPRDAFGSLNVAAHPINGFSDSTKHDSPPSLRRRWTRSIHRLISSAVV